MGRMVFHPLYQTTNCRRRRFFVKKTRLKLGTAEFAILIRIDLFKELPLTVPNERREFSEGRIPGRFVAFLVDFLPIRKFPGVSWVNLVPGTLNNLFF